MVEFLECYTCRQDEPAFYHVKLRGDLLADFDAASDGPDSVRYQHYVKELTFRSAFVCAECYRQLDSFDGAAEINGCRFGIAGSSRGRKATFYDAKKYAAFQKRQMARLGLT